jgi:hypothetical protein
MAARYATYTPSQDDLELDVEQLFPRSPPLTSQKAKRPTQAASQYTQTDDVRTYGTASSFAQRARQTPATSRTAPWAQVKVDSLLTSSRGHREGWVSRLEYNKRLDHTYNPTKDTEHWVHEGCDSPIPSVEGPNSRAERARVRGERRRS